MDSRIFIFWLAAIIPPIFGWGLNAILRGEEAINSACADWLILLFAFDLSAAIASTDFSRYIAYTPIRSAAGGIFIVIGLILIATWMVIVKYVEPAIKRRVADQEPLMRVIQLSAIGWTAAIAGTAINAYTFLYHA